MRIFYKGFLILILTFSASLLFSNEVAAVWTRLYNESASVEQQLAIMANIVEQHDRDMIPVLEDALNQELVNLQNIGSSTEKVKNYRLISMIISEIATLKDSGAAEDVYAVSVETDDPFLHAQAIRTLGRIGAVGYAEEIAFRLRNINLGITPYKAKEEVESIVSACVETLELLRREVGFSPVFFTSIGRYSATVVKRAERAMINMLEDPIDLLLEIMTYESDYNIKYQVLLVADRSQAPEERKAMLAKQALDQGLRFDTSDRRQQVFLSQMRTKAAEMLKTYAGADDDALQLLDSMVRRSFSITETLTALEALGASRSETAAKLLAAFLSELNGKRKEGYTFSNETVVRATINALANTDNPIGRPALIEVEFSNWSGDTRRLAKSALEKLQ